MLAKRRRTDVECFICGRDGLECEGGIPCHNCIRKGHPQMCYRLPSLTQPPPPAAPAPAPPTATAPTPTSSYLAGSSMPAISTATAPSMPVSSPSIAIPGAVRTSTLPPHMAEPRTRPVRGRGRGSASSTTPSMQQQQQQQQRAPVEHADLSQSNVQNYLLQEMRSLKSNYQQLMDEMLSLRMQNLNLVTEVNHLKQFTQQLITNMPAVTAAPASGAGGSVRQVPLIASESTSDSGGTSSSGSGTTNSTTTIGPLSTATSQSSGGTSSELPMVVYDLRHSPAIVLMANDTFCSMLGYSMSEVIGMSWRNFIHPDCLQRTVAHFADHNLANTTHLQFSQYYKHRNGSIFETYDTHVILHDAKGQPVSAVVTIQFRCERSPNEIPGVYAPMLYSASPPKYRPALETPASSHQAIDGTPSAQPFRHTVTTPKVEVMDDSMESLAHLNTSRPFALAPFGGSSSSSSSLAPPTTPSSATSSPSFNSNAHGVVSANTNAVLLSPASPTVVNLSSPTATSPFLEKPALDPAPPLSVPLLPEPPYGEVIGDTPSIHMDLEHQLDDNWLSHHSLDHDFVSTLLSSSDTTTNWHDVFGNVDQHHHQ